MTTPKQFSGFWSNPWTRIIIPLTAIGAVSWAVMNEQMSQVKEAISKSSSKNETLFKSFTHEINTLKSSQAKDDQFRERGERFDKSSALALELRLKSEFKDDIDAVMGRFTSDMKTNQVETVRLIEKLSDKIDKMIDNKK